MGERLTIQKRIRIVLMILVAALALIVAQRAWADDAPPPNAAASDVVPGRGTQVQMIAETVVLDVRVEPLQMSKWNSDLTTTTVAVVTADFIMRNLGSVVETLDVRFPMSWPSPWAGSPAEFGRPIQDVKTFVDGVEVPNKQVDFDGQPWVVRPVQFAPGQDVRLTVKYRALPINWSAFVDFYYILETGAGWRGPIGQGDIIFRFPYPADPEMLARNEPSAQAYYTSTTPALIVEGNQLRWHFKNLEPTSKDNVRLSVLNPEVWQAILDARGLAHSNSNDAKAHLRLGLAYYAAIPIERGFWPDNSPLAKHFGPLAEAAFNRAVKLAPTSVPARLAYARFLFAHAQDDVPEPYYGRACEEVRRVFELEPDNEDAQQLAVEWEAMGDLTCFPEPTATAQPKATATVALSPTPRPSDTATPRPSDTATPHPSDTPPPTVSPQPPATRSPTATPPTATRAPGLCGGGAAMLLIAGLATLSRRC